MLNYDEFIINEREKYYYDFRKKKFIEKFMLHFNKKCNCIKNNKICNFSDIDINKFNNEDYLAKLYDIGALDSIYNISQSITQSLRNYAGKELENIIKCIFDTLDIPYSYQVKINNHRVDFTIPKYIKNFNGYILSIKTSLRERFHQDNKYMNIRYITFDKKEGDEFITIDKDEMNLTKFLCHIQDLYCKTSLRVLDLFCGAGGFSKGFDLAKFNIVAAIDIWDKAIESYKLNHPNTIALCKDLTLYSPEDFEKEYQLNHFDIIIGGPPCQGYSNAGRRDCNDPRNSLFMEYKKYVDFYKPKMFIIENVIGILSMKYKDKKVIDIIISEFSDYKLTITKLMASDFGVPQNRKRVLIFGIRDSTKTFSPPVSCTDRIPVKTVIEEKVDDKYYLSNKALEGIKRRKEKMKKEKKGFGAQILNPDRPSYTIPARYWKDGYDALWDDNGRLRRLTIKELSRIQSFPDDYKFYGSRKDQIIQIGNAVACRFAYYIAIHVKKFLTNESYNNITVKELKKLCKEKKIKGYSRLRKLELINLLSSS